MYIFYDTIVTSSSILSPTFFFNTNSLYLFIFMANDHAFKLMEQLLIKTNLPNLLLRFLFV